MPARASGLCAALRNRKVRNWSFQAVIVLALLGILAAFWTNVSANLARQGVEFGFDFLFRATRWDLSASFIRQEPSDPYWLTFLVGIANSLILAGCVLPLATFVGILLAWFRISGNPTLLLVARLYVVLFRNLPLPFQLLFWYAIVIRLPAPRQALDFGGIAYLSNRGLTLPAIEPTAGFWYALAALLFATVAALTGWVRAREMNGRPGRSLVGWLAAGLFAAVAGLYFGGVPSVGIPRLEGFRFAGGMTLSSEFTALLVSIVLFGGAYISECIRGGVEAVPRGQTEAASAFGLKRWQVFFLVVLPQALPNIVPPVGNQYLFLVRATTLGVSVGYSDVFMVASSAINQTAKVVEILILMGCVFLTVNYLLTRLINLINRAVSFDDRSRG